MTAPSAQSPEHTARGQSSRRRVLRRVPTRHLPFVIGLAAIVLGWTAVAAVTPSTILPSPAVVVARAIVMIREPYLTATLQEHILVSLARVSAGLLLGCAVGLMFGLVMHFVPIVRGFLEFILSLLRPLPPFTLIAVFIVWFGLGEASKVALIFFGVFARMAIYVVTAFRALPADLSDAGRSLGVTGWRMFASVRLPAALPDLLIGMRILLAIAWTSVMGAELIAANEGIGWAIWAAARNLQTDVIFVGILTIAALGSLMDAGMVWLTRRATGGWAARVREA